MDSARRFAAGIAVLALIAAAMVQAQTPPSISLLTPELREQIGAAMKIRDFNRAEQMLTAEIERRPEARDLLVFLGGLFFLDGKYLNCAIAFKKAEKLAPLDDANRFTLAMAYIVLKRPEWARPEFERLARSQVANSLYPYWLGRLDYDARLYEPAIASFRRAIELDPDFARAYDSLGLSLDLLGRLDEAIAAHRRAAELNRRKPPSSPWLPLNYGILLTKMGRLDEAEQLFRESARYDEKFGNAHYQLGVVLEKKGRLDDAVTALEKAARLQPEWNAPHLVLGRIYRALGRTANSQKEFAEFRRLRERPDP
jgi:tetratricopeptide (TPR) repeat protein